MSQEMFPVVIAEKYLHLPSIREEEPKMNIYKKLMPRKHRPNLQNRTVIDRAIKIKNLKDSYTETKTRFIEKPISVTGKSSKNTEPIHQNQNRLIDHQIIKAKKLYSSKDQRSITVTQPSSEIKQVRAITETSQTADFDKTGKTISELRSSIQKFRQSQSIRLSIKQELKNKLELLWNERMVPNCHKVLIRQIINKKSSNQIRLIQSEISHIQKKDANVMRIMSLIRHRQEKVSTLKILVNHISSVSEATNKKAHSKIFQQIKSTVRKLRLLNLNTIQNILKWRQQMSRLYRKHLKMLVSDVVFHTDETQSNYLSRILNDCAFLGDKTLFKDCCPPDPFFLSYGLQQQAPQEYFKIRACQLLLVQESLL